MTAKKVCIVTPDLLGFVRNGGIGTACTFLAEHLAQSGYQVCVFYTQNQPECLPAAWQQRYDEQGIEIVVGDDAVPDTWQQVFPCHAPLRMAWKVYAWLADQQFDLVFFMEWQGAGFYALNAKRAGLGFENCTMVTHIHSPSIWHAIHNAQISSNPMDALTYFMERKCIELADAVVSPSQYMLDWTQQHGFVQPAVRHVLPNLFDGSAWIASQQIRRSKSIRELVFFGRLEYRKGIVQFCDAIDRLVQTGTLPERVVFLGKFAKIEQEHAGQYLSRRMARWKFPVDIRAAWGHSQALAYLVGENRLAVMPSVADNSPYTVFECLALGIPFLARDVGGVAELLHSKDRARTLFGDNPGELADLFRAALKAGVRPARLAFDLDTVRKEWVTFIDSLSTQTSGSKTLKSVTPRVSVCLVHCRRPHLLRQAVKSLLDQDYDNFEVILVDDGSSDAKSTAYLDELEVLFKRRSWKIIRQSNAFLGKARNVAAQRARGEYLLFMDDDNVACKDMVSTFAKAAAVSGARVVTTAFNVFASDQAPNSDTEVLERYLPVGGVVSYSLLANAIGDANSLIERKLFNRLGGFTEDYGVGHEDFELYLRAALSEESFCVIPKPLFWYRRNANSMLSSTPKLVNSLRSFRPFMAHLSAPLAELALMSHGAVQALASSAGVTNVEHTKPIDTDVDARMLDNPDSLDAVIEVCKVMLRRGQNVSAIQILGDVLEAEAAKTKQPNGLIYQVHEFLTLPAAGAAEQTKRLLDMLDTISTINRDSVVNVLSLLLLALSNEKADPDILRLFSNRLLDAEPESIDANLDVGLVLARCGDHVVALQCFVKAISIAEQNYVAQRRDVAQAISSGQIQNGLIHYGRYGKREAAIWPARSKFHEVASELRVLVDEPMPGSPEISSVKFFDLVLDALT